jgi:hypothetical protein
MRWQLGGDWPVGAGLIPAGTITDGAGLPMPMPINAVALDDDAALQMCMWYDEAATIGGWHHLHFAPGIDREAIFAQARHNKRWPNGMPSPLSLSSQ